MEGPRKSYYRYTDLTFVLEALSSSRLTLVNPSLWEDKNDVAFIDKYRQLTKTDVRGLCFTHADETYHHWKIYTHGVSGACIRFDAAKFHTWLDRRETLVGRPIVYKTTEELEKSPPSYNELWSTKRQAYAAEGEFRLFVHYRHDAPAFVQYLFDRDMIVEVLLNPWIPDGPFQVVKKVIASLDGCQDIDVRRSSVVTDQKWMEIAQAVAKPGETSPPLENP